MAKKIEFIAPVEAMRGNLSGAQKLLYPTQDNSAWDAPSDKQSYATNYQPRYVGAKRSRDNKKFFSVRTKNAVTLTDNSRRAMALLGNASEFANNILRNLATLNKLQTLFVTYAPQGYTIKRWIMEQVRSALLSKSPSITFDETGDPSTVYKNPFTTAVLQNVNYIRTGADSAIPLNRLVFKFWETLGLAGAKKIKVEMVGYGYFYILAVPSQTFVTQYVRDTASQAWQPNRYVFDRVGNSITANGLMVDNNPDNTKVWTSAPGTIDPYDLYRHAVGETAEDDVLVDSVTDSPEEGYVYTFKPRA